MAPAFAPPSVSVIRSAVPRLSTCDHVAAGAIVSSNKVFFISFPVEFLGQDDRFSEVAHGPAQTAAFAPHVEICLFLRDSVPMLQYPLRALDDLSRLERPLHFQRFGDESCVLKCQCRLTGDSL